MEMIHYTPQELAAIAMVICLVELAKRKVPKKYARYLALPFGFFFAACIIVDTGGGWPGFWVFLAREVQIGSKITLGAMGLFDLLLKPRKMASQVGAEREKKEGLE